MVSTVMCQFWVEWRDHFWQLLVTIGSGDLDAIIINLQIAWHTVLMYFMLWGLSSKSGYLVFFIHYSYFVSCLPHCPTIDCCKLSQKLRDLDSYFGKGCSKKTLMIYNRDYLIWISSTFLYKPFSKYRTNPLNQFLALNIYSNITNNLL